MSEERTIPQAIAEIAIAGLVACRDASFSVAIESISIWLRDRASGFANVDQQMCLESAAADLLKLTECKHASVPYRHRNGTLRCHGCHFPQPATEEKR